MRESSAPPGSCGKDEQIAIGTGRTPAAVDSLDDGYHYITTPVTLNAVRARKPKINRFFCG
jgi:hypothetical protein